jgi:hypothetical protein
MDLKDVGHRLMMRKTELQERMKSGSMEMH